MAAVAEVTRRGMRAALVMFDSADENKDENEDKDENEENDEEKEDKEEKEEEKED